MLREIGLASLAALSLTACASIDGYPKNPIDQQADMVALKRDYDRTAIEAYAVATDPTARQRLRDQIVRTRIAVYTKAFSDYERSLTQQHNLWNVGTGFTGLGLGTAATLAKQASTKTNLSAYALAVTGARGEVSKDLYYEKTLPAILVQMEANLTKARAVIELGLTKSDAGYPLSAALADLDNFSKAGNMAAAISAITQSAGEQKAEAERQVGLIREGVYGPDDSTQKLNAWLRGGDPAKLWNPDLQDKLEDWIAKDTKTSKGDIPLVMFLDEPRYAASRARAVADQDLKVSK